MRKPIITYVVQRLHDEGPGAQRHRWEYLDEDGTWTFELLAAKTWQRVRYADKVSLQHLGAIVTPYEV